MAAAAKVTVVCGMFLCLLDELVSEHFTYFHCISSFLENNYIVNVIK